MDLTVKTTGAAASSSSGGVVEEKVNEKKYKGVRKRKWGKYVSEIRLPNSRDRIWLGSYDTAEKAARAFDAALFCLRGPTANFNFPEDPPRIPGGQALAPTEIQAVAQHYANSSGGDNPPDPPAAVELEDASPPSNSIDWSFLDLLDSNSTSSTTGGGNAGHVSDFGLFHDPAEMYIPPPPPIPDDNDDDHGIVPSFLWNF
ncbi:hypothetical protein ACP275_01G034600 [Erythranthe tilingii]